MKRANVVVWDIDRWRSSEAFLFLTAAQQAIHRELVDEHCACRGPLPNDLECLRARANATPEEWSEHWPVVSAFWQETSGGLVPTEPLAVGKWRWSPREDPFRRHRRWIPLRVRVAVMTRDGWRCQFCGATERLELDHITPFSLGGEDFEDNLRTLCKPCNVRRGVGP